MGEINEVGWYLKLERIIDKKGSSGNIKKNKEKEKVKQPLF